MMNKVCRDIFRAIHEGKWLKIEYRNREGTVTKYWIGIRDLDAESRTLAVDGLHLRKYTLEAFERIYIDSILSSEVIEGSWCEVNQRLVRDIYENPHQYRELFENTANLKILNYLEMCSKMDTTPYYSEFALVRYLDHESFRGDCFELSEEQFQTIVKHFQYQNKRKQHDGRLVMQLLAMNILSIHTRQGLYVLACRRLGLDVKRRVLRPEEDITVCTEYTLNGTVQSARRFLDADDFELLREFEKNQEKIKDRIAENGKGTVSVDDMPYIIGLGLDVPLDLHREYEAILKMYQEDRVTIPIRAFFGELLSRPVRRKAYPIALFSKHINLDQLLAIHNGMKYPVAYIQGPPGTGKTNTILNTILTAFFNEKTVLFSSYNNHPLDSVFEKLTSLKYRNREILFPVIRLGNIEKLRETLQRVSLIYERAKSVTVYASTLDRRKDDRTERAGRLSVLLERYEEILDLQERKETLNRVVEYQSQMNRAMGLLPFQADLQDRQLGQIKQRMKNIGEVKEEEALELLDSDEEELYKYLYYVSAKYIQRLGEKKNEDLRNILEEEDKKTQLEAFSKYLSKTENIKKLQKIFPVVITTCISAHRVGEPEPLFDMVIMDEASQCNTAVSLVPIIRGTQLMLVGDPQQLNPVILLDEITNQCLRRKYSVSDEYDYRENSIYKTFLMCDSVSDEVLLHNHYRCNEKIISFNNKKYYHSRLNILSESNEKHPLLCVEVKNDRTELKNTAQEEVREIVRFAAQHRDRSIGVITPFVNQKRLIEEELKKEGLTGVLCGTVHAFQGDEKDVILFSTVLSDSTHEKTYEWLKNNKELINVATSRARDQLIVFADSGNLKRLHETCGGKDADDLYELITYVKENGVTKVTEKKTNSRALGVKPFSTAMEEAFLENLTHALENIWLSQNRYTVHREVAISQVFQDNRTGDGLFYSGRFDFVVYEQHGKKEIPVLAIELDGREHYEDEIVRARDRKKEEICRAHNLQLIRVENAYARRYHHVKEILISYFSVRH